jgi:Na+/H+ antiporter NhaC
MKWLIQYIYEIKLDKIILWCYLIWYLIIIYFYFDPALKLWSNSVGISAVIGTGLMLSVSSSKVDGIEQLDKTNEKDYWQMLRLYLMPFCVSSFSALIKDQGFILFISPKIQENLIAILGCFLFCLFVMVIKSVNREATEENIEKS